MDVDKLFVKVNSLQNYIDITKDVSMKYTHSKIQLNVSTVLWLKKARYLEIEYFNECNGHGAAVIIIERLLEVGRSKTWGLLGKELVSLLQHWLDSTRKHLILMNKNWWSFMNLLLKFIKELRLKDTALPDLLVESTAEPLLDLATRSKEVDVNQQLDILYCLNLCCADSSREVRFATRHHLESYFVKLSELLAGSGHVPAQCSALETLVRWLLPRHDRRVRRAAAAAWLPGGLYTRNVVDIFLERQWQNFYLDARDFINAHNEARGRAVSAVYLQLTVGRVTVECSPKRDAWMDINPATKSITFLLEPRMMEALGLTAASLHTLVVDNDAVTKMKLGSEASEVTLAIKTSRPLRVHPTDEEVGGGGNVKVVVSKRNDLRRLHKALGEVFGDKYETFAHSLDQLLRSAREEKRLLHSMFFLFSQTSMEDLNKQFLYKLIFVLIDFDDMAATPPHDMNKKIVSSSDEDTRFSHPVRPTRRRVSGYVTKSASAWKSPSTTSTTSLALLHDRLEALPKFRFSKEPIRVAALPDLSIVSELTEIIDTQSIASGSSNNRPYRGGFKSLKKSTKKSQSDGETYIPKKCLSPIVSGKEHNPSCLLVATIGTDESVINETIESLSKTKNCGADNIVDLLLKEALQSKDDKSDSGIITGENRKSPELRDSDAIEDTPNLEPSKPYKNKRATIFNDDEYEECNEIDESQFGFVSVRKKVLINKQNDIEEDTRNGIEANDLPTFDEEAVEKFFSEHIAEDRSGGIVVSPSLARKINETSSEGSDFQDCLVEDFTYAENIQENFTNVDNMQDVEIIDCLNNIIDKVCLDIEKCAEILGSGNSRMDLLKMSELKEVERNDSSRVLATTDNLDPEVVETPKKKPKQKNVIKLKFKTKKILNRTRSQKQNNLASKMSPIPENKDSIEQYNEPHIIEETHINPEVTKTIKNVPAEVIQMQPKENAVASPQINNVSPKSIDNNASLIRRRRKLYSPKDLHIKTDSRIEKSDKHELEVHYLQDDDGADFKSDSKKTPKYAATCYKDIEKTRKRQIRLPKTRKPRGKARSPSPKTKNKQIFDSLKTNVEEHVDIILAEKKSPSPRTKKMNELFDNLKTDVERHDIVLADKKYNEEELAVFNFTSDSEDEDFKKKKVEIKKRISSTTNASGDSTVSRHGRIINKVNYSERSSDETTKNTKTNPVRRKRTRQRRPHNLADEKMRQVQHEDLNTSFVVKKDKEVLNDPEPIIEAPPQMELMGGELDEPVIPASRSNKTGRKKKKVADKKETKHNIDKKIDNDDRTLSPLPGLVIEKMQTLKDDPNDSVCTQVMDNLKKIYHEDPAAVDESNYTQNLLQGNEKVEFSQQMYIFNDFGRMSPNIPDIIQRTNDAKPKTRKNNAILTDDDNIIEVISFEENTANACKKKDDGVFGNISDVPSEKSIATVGNSPINAHGNVDEDPPDKSHLVKRVQSRNLEIEDMDTSIKDYYLKLREEINKPVNSSASSSGKLEIDLARKNPKCISLVEKMFSKSTDDTSRWIQIQISGETRIDLVENIAADGSINSIPAAPSSNRCVNMCIEHDEVFKCQRIRNDTDKLKVGSVGVSSNSSRKCISPVVSLTKMSYDDISKWLPSGRNSSDASTHSSEKSKIIDKTKDVSEKSLLRPNAKDLRSVSQKTSKIAPNKHIEKENATTETNNKLHYNLRAPKPISSIKRIETDIDCNNNYHKSITTGRKSMISPIKNFDDILEEKSKSISLTNRKVTGLQTNKIKRPILNISASSKKYDLRKSTTGISSGESNISSSTRVDGRVSARGTMKRKSESPVGEGKRRREEVLTDSSGPSLASVDEWLKRSAPISAAKSLTDSYGESLQNIMERLDTTLAEIHQNTSKNFVHLFVEAQRRLAQARGERRRALQLVAGDVLKEVVDVLDRKFEDLEKRTQEMDTEFMEQLKNRAAEFIREDCRKKQVLVAMLQDDIRASASRGQNRDTQ